jgi:rhamnopyranosyl-N-acetylglucosaminyl-diphospho-decaprenol beta-1,3/1,4-galactofuranosyltransferase
VSENKHETVAAVVVTYNRKELLRQCLGGILAQTRPVDAIYVVDNASTDGTDQMIAAEYADRVIYER